LSAGGETEVTQTSIKGNFESETEKLSSVYRVGACDWGLNPYYRLKVEGDEIRRTFLKLYQGISHTKGVAFDTDITMPAVQMSLFRADSGGQRLNHALEPRLIKSESGNLSYNTVYEANACVVLLSAGALNPGEYDLIVSRYDASHGQQIPIRRS